MRDPGTGSKRKKAQTYPGGGYTQMVASMKKTLGPTPKTRDPFLPTPTMKRYRP